jgi:hypothetical protein
MAIFAVGIEHAAVGARRGSPAQVRGARLGRACDARPLAIAARRREERVDHAAGLRADCSRWIDLTRSRRVAKAGLSASAGPIVGARSAGVRSQVGDPTRAVRSFAGHAGTIAARRAANTVDAEAALTIGLTSARGAVLEVSEDRAAAISRRTRRVAQVDTRTGGARDERYPGRDRGHQPLPVQDPGRGDDTRGPP